ncbi:MAG: DUF1343 domain-containing protein [Syntrophaceae bacterium]|nr:DUF1343 domain-containing protein [Syntrophaceae bacterium]
MKKRGRFTRHLFLFSLFFLLPGSVTGYTQTIRTETLATISPIVEEAIRQGQTPGAVVLIGQREKIVFRQAFGNRTYGPQRAAMTVDTLFDLASLTKVVATAPALLQLVESGGLSLDDPVVKHWPDFRGYDKERITVRQLLTHYSGLRASLSLKKDWLGYESALEKIVAEKPLHPPDYRFLYSDINFIILGELVRRVSGKSLPAYCRDHIFQPLEMQNSFFLPPAPLYGRLAPAMEDHLGKVHDPVALRMGGFGGHAGVFSTADDLALFAQAILGEGLSAGKAILSPQTVQTMVLPQSPVDKLPQRGLGWAIHSPVNSDAGSNWSECLPPGSFGHKGYTGTLIWIDTISRTYLIVLTNRVFPTGKAGQESLRDQVFSIVAQAAGRAVSPSLCPQTFPAASNGLETNAPTKVKTGIDVLADQKFAPLMGKKVGLITNQTGRALNGQRTIDLLHQAAKVKLKAILAPEHGLSGKAESKVPSTRDPVTGLPVHSLYGDTLMPTPKMLKGLDVLVFDVQDAGVRFYTYITTLGYAMEAAARKGIPFHVLDRPNPITGSRVQGPVLDEDLRSFTGYFPLPVRHGMTVGELARMFNEENKMGVRLSVVSMTGYRRSAWFDETGIPWVNPSPNLRSLTQATLYPGVALVEGANVSVGRGTDRPFELLGAPWIKARELADSLSGRHIPGVEFRPATFTPDGSRFKGQACYGVQVILTDRQALDSALLGLEIIATLWRLYPQDFEIDKTLSLVGSRSVHQAIKDGLDPHAIAQAWQPKLEQFRQIRSRYLLYPE